MKSLLVLFCISMPLFALDPGSLRVKVYGVWMSKSVYCTRPVTVFRSDEAGYLDFIGKPALGSLDNTDNTYDGTYPCIIIKMSELIKFSPKTTVGYCTGGAEYTQKFCGAGLSTIDPDTASTSECSGSDTSEDTVFMYLSTASTGSSLTTSSNPFLPPTAANAALGLTLGSPWVIAGAYTTDFIVNAYDRVVSASSTCTIDTPTFTFSEATE